MEFLSVFDMFKVGIGPSSSHTMGPWRATQLFLPTALAHAGHPLTVHLFGSLAKTGKGHGTDLAILLALSGFDPETIDPEVVFPTCDAIRENRRLPLGGGAEIPFDPAEQIQFHRTESLPFHPNGMTFEIAGIRKSYYSVGGGFVVSEDQADLGANSVRCEPAHPIHSADDLLALADSNGLSIAELVLSNEAAWGDESSAFRQLDRLIGVMIQCAHRGCRTGGTLPGGLNVSRRAKALCEKLLGFPAPEDADGWLKALHQQSPDFDNILKWVSCFALAVNEENASFGRVVTAPTNGAAGVIPAVMLYLAGFKGADTAGLRNYLLVAGQIGILFKQGATISAAMGGCQAEIGVSSAMAAAGMTATLGGSNTQVMMAAEIAMEHHLGLTCDPIGGLVQIPCIERNTMGAIKAITASQIALESDPTKAKVSLDAVIKSMWETAQDMNSKYKETAEGGLAVAIPVSVPEC